MEPAVRPVRAGAIGDRRKSTMTNLVTELVTVPLPTSAISRRLNDLYASQSSARTQSTVTNLILWNVAVTENTVKLCVCFEVGCGGWI